MSAISSYRNDSESEGVIAVLDVNVLAAVAADAVIRRGSSSVAAVDCDGLAALGGCNGDEI